MKRRRQEPDKGAPKWMTTFSDMVLLILVFFVMLFSMSEIDAERFRAIADSFEDRQIMEFMPSAIEFDNPERDSDEFEEARDDLNELEDEDSDEDEATDELAEGEELDDLQDEIEEYLVEEELQEVITATRDDRGIVLVLQERLLFDSAEAELLPEAEPFLSKVSTLLNNVSNMVEVEGHTDDRPISTERYPSNWELSGARASSVIRYLTEEEGLPGDRFVATGYGDTRPVAPNDSEENLRQNRRVVLIVSDPSYEEELRAEEVEEE
ncbi:flagellar motor protein MotS [Salsuginibacillus kocurii]|uniref:flagellar motor protein MotS n=1 Tax=Salsuginibacillus kocurii TaxID=427078 RepID=UPI00036ED66B|nr:flagellar motor protein MotS [Salsuginibacillus kocurii]